jgi:hypothetical protein
MARTHGRIKVEVWDAGSEFRELGIDAQWAYQMLVSQPSVSMCGTLAYTPKKWAKLARGLTLEVVEEALLELEEAWYVILDRDTDEVLIRSFVKHNTPWAMGNLVTAGRRQFREIDSEAIRVYLRERHPWLVDASMKTEQIREYEEGRASEGPSERTIPLALGHVSEQVSQHVSEDVSEHTDEHTRSRARRAGARTAMATTKATATANESSNLGRSTSREADDQPFDGEEPGAENGPGFQSPEDLLKEMPS